MAIIQRFVDIPAGATVSAGTVTLGEFDERDQRDRYKLRQIRVWPLNGYNVQLSCTLTCPGGALVGPVDLPMTFNVELPVTIAVTCPTAETFNQRIMCVASDLPGSPNLHSATRFATVAVGVLVPIPDACVAVTLLTVGGTLTYYNAALVAIGDGNGSQMIARPRLAKFVGVSEPGGSVLFHY